MDVDCISFWSRTFGRMDKLLANIISVRSNVLQDPESIFKKHEI